MGQVIIGTKKFADLGGFPIDPDDFQALRTGMKHDEIAIYLRLFSEDGFIRRIVIMSSIDTLNSAWRTQTQIGTMNNALVVQLTDKVYQTFSQQRPPSSSNQGIATVAMRVLCMHYLPQLRQLKVVPVDNIVGVIFEYKDQRLKEYCYSQFSLDTQINTPKANLH